MRSLATLISLIDLWFILKPSDRLRLDGKWPTIADLSIFGTCRLHTLDMAKLSLTARKDIKDSEPKLQANLKMIEVRSDLSLPRSVRSFSNLTSLDRDWYCFPNRVRLSRAFGQCRRERLQGQSWRDFELLVRFCASSS